jgi:hypothetical protein
MTAARQFNRWLLRPVTEPGREPMITWERPNPVSLLEHLRVEADIPRVARANFRGTGAQRNLLVAAQRSFLRQAISNFRAALTVENRSASLLYYYAMLNFAKAELLRVTPASVLGFIPHGLQFSVSRARTVGGDALIVRDGVFRRLYELRTGLALPEGTRIPVVRLLQRIPEIGDQLSVVSSKHSVVQGVIQLLAYSESEVWVLLAVDQAGELDQNTATGRLFRRVFHRVESPPNWRDRFGISRRSGAMAFYESRAFAFPPGDLAAQGLRSVDAEKETWRIKDLLERTGFGMWDAWLSPSVYRTRMMPMPPALARYAVSFYASSLVRYRPSLFDLDTSPEQAFLFDAVARECAVPMLVDTLRALSATEYVFLADDAFRL